MVDGVLEGPSKHCTTQGCGGTMRLGLCEARVPDRDEAALTLFGPVKWKWASHLAWVCDRDAAHLEVLTPDEVRAQRRRKRT